MPQWINGQWVDDNGYPAQPNHPAPTNWVPVHRIDPEPPPDDLQALANAQHQPSTINVYAPSYAPRRRSKTDRSPFAWGFYVTLGILAAIVVVCLGFSLLGNLTTAAKRIEKEHAEPVEPAPPPRPKTIFDMPGNRSR